MFSSASARKITRNLAYKCMAVCHLEKITLAKFGHGYCDTFTNKNMIEDVIDLYLVLISQIFFFLTGKHVIYLKEMYSNTFKNEK